MSLYTQYRPKDWNDVVGQDLIVTILRANLQDKTTSHAYIFTGSRGTGKTTSARIFAKAVNCTNLQNGNPCHKCENCKAFDAGNMLDVIEIDAASHNSVDDVRDLIEKAKFEPTQGEYKVYIIDEVHMLSTSAFNALLKILEEPPKHVKFILATTDIHKVLDTIQSRSHRFDFRKIPEDVIVTNLLSICEQEGIEAEKEALQIIARASHGGMRDAITLLEQYSIHKKLTKKSISEALSLLDDTVLEEIIETLLHQNFNKLTQHIDALKSIHIQVVNFFDQILLLLRDKMRENLSHETFFGYEKIYRIFQKSYSSLRSMPDHFLLLEMTLMQAIHAQDTSSTTITNIPATKIDKPIENRNSEESIRSKFPTMPPKIEETGIAVNISTKNPIPQETQIKPQETTEVKNTKEVTSEFSYRKLLEELKSDPVILATLKTASFKHNGTHIDFTFSSKWNSDKMNESKYQNAVISALEKCFGGNWTISSSHASNQNLIDDVF